MPSSLDRRDFLRATGVSLALPFFESSLPASPAGAAHGSNAGVKRLVCIGNPFGMYPPAFYPEEVGEEYTLPALLEPLARHRGSFTVFSHLDHGVGGGHAGARAFLSGVRPIHAGSMPERNITIDQKAAEFVGTRTRYPVLNLGVGGTWEMCWTRDAVRVPAVCDPRKVFDLLFVQETEAVAAGRERRLLRDASILDAVRDQSRSFAARLGASDRIKLEEYLSSIREVEKRIEASRAWLHEPKPEVGMERPEGGSQALQLPLLLDLIALALQTDSTRVAALEIKGAGLGAALDLRGSYHKYSHHGKRPELVEGLMRIEKLQTVQLARFLDKLECTPDPLNGGTLLDHTMVLFGSGLGNGNSHSCRNLPVLLAGGGLRHGRHVSLPSEEGRRVPLCNLYLSVLRRFGLELEQFGTSTGPLSELEA